MNVNMDSYVSCIKIRGMPILPPLMTDDCKMEMIYYKKLALAVEDKLAKLRLANDINASKINNIDETFHINDDNDLDIQCVNQQLNPSTITRIPASNEFTNVVKSESSNGEWRATSSDDDTINISTDTNKLINPSDSSKTDVTDTISDIIKPNVPNTLPIIPITLDNLNTPKSRELSSDIEESEREIPKLVRQGSYILDTPSPMLLAHLEHSKENSVSSRVTDGLKRRAISLMGDKSEWKNDIIHRDSIMSHCSSDNDIPFKLRRNSISGCETNRRGNKSVRGRYNQQLINSKRHTVRSADCIPMMFSKRHTRYSSKDNEANIVIKNGSMSDGRRYSDDIKYKMNKNIENVNLINKFGGSLGTLGNKNSMDNKNTCQLDNEMSKSLVVPLTDNHKMSHSLEKSKHIIVSEKLVHVFKEIQKTHERQMADLMARQKNEQIIMQQEFQKQQLMLLSKIEKSFPELALSSMGKKITALPINNKPRGQCSSYNSTLLSKSTEHNGSHNSTGYLDYMKNHSDLDTSPINGSSFESDESVSLNFSMRERSLAEMSMTNERRKSNVSRELFPLESNITHVNVIIKFNYDERHRKAATIINAYARGYLVRRLMKTERVITLKNTYREALHYMLKLHIDAPLELAELKFHQRLKHQCDAASISIVELFSQNSTKKMEIISHDRQIKKSRQERPTSGRSSYSFATQRTLARKKIKELGISQIRESTRRICAARTRCQTWTSNTREKKSPGIINQGIKRSTSAGAVRKPWR